MKLFKLDSSFKPGPTIGNFESLAWTERFDSAGDFQLVIENDISVLTILPKGVLISHTDTLEVMIVENREIERDAKKNLKVTLSGRSFETFTENRVTGGYNIPLQDGSGNTYIQYFAAGTASSVASTLLKLALEPGTAPTEDAITNLLVQTSIRAPDAAMEHVVKRGAVYSQVLEYLRLSNAGIKIVRPVGVATTMNLVIHDGLDLSNSVIFYSQYEDLEDTKYFESIKEYKNYAAIAAHIYARVYRNRDLPTDVTGLDRRVLYMEADDLQGNYTPATASDVISARAQSELDIHQQISLIQAQISKTARPKFKINYNIGDIVLVFGEFGTAQPMRVTEHILTVDKNGMQGYPSLSLL